MNEQGHPPFVTARIADVLRDCGVAPTDPMNDILPGHRYLLMVDPHQVSNASIKKLQEFLAEKQYDISVIAVAPAAARMFDVSESGEEYFAYVNSHLLCAECGWAMSPSSSNHTVRPFDYIVHCYNSSCSRKEIRFRVRASQGVRLERVDPEGKEENHAPKREG